MRRSVVASLVACCALVVGASAAPSTTTKFESADHRVSVEVPAEWKIEQVPSDHAAISLRASEPVLWLDVFHEPGFRDERCQACFERASQVEMHDGATPGEVSLAPSPHLVMKMPAGERFPLDAWLYRVIRRNGFTLKAQCEEATWPVVKDACFAALKSLASSIPEWPEPPEGFATSLREGYEFQSAPNVSEKEIVDLVAFLLDEEKKYAKSHGRAVPKTADDPPIVVVARDAKALAAIDSACRGDAHASQFFGRLYVVPPARDDFTAHGRIAGAASSLFHAQCYGALASPWLATGAARLADAEAALGRPLPSLPDDCALPKTVAPFEKLVHAPGRDAAEQATAYVALFRCGAKPWRDAFALFLKDLATTGDWETAEKTRLLSLDQDKLRAAAQAWVNEKRAPKGK